MPRVFTDAFWNLSVKDGSKLREIRRRDCTDDLRSCRRSREITVQFAPPLYGFRHLRFIVKIMYGILTMQGDGGAAAIVVMRICDAGNLAKAGPIAEGTAGGGRNPVGGERRANMDAQDDLIDQLECALS